MRRHPTFSMLLGACAALALSGIAQAAAPAAPAPSGPAPRTAWGTPDFGGTWETSDFTGWKELPYTPAYAAVYAKRKADQANGIPYDDPPGRCITSGMPRTMTSGAYPMEVFHSEKQVTTTRENLLLGGIRRIRMDRAEHDLSMGPTYMGDSVARWEGDVLVVDTVGFRDDSVFNLIEPHSTDMHIVERFRRPDRDTLVNEMTITDPKALTRPITATITYKRTDLELKEYVCENNRYQLDANGKPRIN